MFSQRRRFAAIAVVALLASCGESDASDSGDAGVGGDDAQTAEVSFNGADVMFAQMMIPHHEQAIEMSDIALDPSRGASAAILDLATQIKNAQDPEIAQMKALLQAWGKPVMPDDGMDHSSMMSGMLTLEELEALGQLAGPEFDAAWAKAMIAHHEGAIVMAEDVLSGGVNAETRALAEAIIAGQSAEIAILTPIANS